MNGSGIQIWSWRVSIYASGSIAGTASRSTGCRVLVTGLEVDSQRAHLEGHPRTCRESNR